MMKSRPSLSICIFVFLTLSSVLKAQDVILQGWYWDYPKTAANQNWTDTLKAKVNNLSEKGFTHIWLPPFSRASFGNNSNGYDPKDLYDLGGYGLGPTGFGTRAQVDTLISKINAKGMKAVADVVYNHRDGGKPEINASVEGWIENYNCTKKNSGDNPYPSDRVRIILPLGGSSMNGAGTYYFKIASASKHPDFYNKQFKFYTQTNTVGFQNLPALTESEPNGGGDCGQPNNVVQLGRDMNSWLDTYGSSCTSGSCGVEEFALTISGGQFNPAGDTLYIYLTNVGAYSDHFIYGFWSGARSMDIVGELKYQTYTDFTNMPSGRASMDHTNFKPNGNPTNLNGDWDSMLFFYDYDQSKPDTRQELIDWSQWLADSIKINGLRMDAVKHFDYNFTADLLDSMYLTNQTPDLVVGEFFDFNAGALKGWVDNVENNMLPAAKTATEVRVFDFALRGALEAACDQTSYDVRNVFQSGVVNGASGNFDQSVTFVNNHDFRGSGEMVDNDAELAYAYILANPTIGIPTIFYPDYYGTDIPNSPDIKLKAGIDRLIEVRNKFIINPTGTEYLNRYSTPHAINYFQGSANKTLTFISKSGGLDPNNEALTVINFSDDSLVANIPLGALSVVPDTTIFFERTGKSLTPFSKKIGGALTVALPPKSYGVWVNIDVESDCGFSNPIYVDKNSAGANDGGSWSNAFNDLNSALILASTCPDIDTIFVKEGIYTPTYTNDRTNSFYLPQNINVFGGFSSIGNPTFASRNPQTYPTILSGNIGASGESDNTYHTLTTSYAVNDSSLLDGFIIEKGNANGIAENAIGGGIFNTGNLKLFNCTVRNNVATEGDAIYNNFSSSLTMKNVKLMNNTGGSSDVKNIENSKVIIIDNFEIKE